MKLCLAILLLCFQFFKAQNKSTYLQSQVILSENISFSKKIDSLISLRKEQFTTSLAEGSLTTFTKNRKRKEIGGFSVEVTREIITGKVFKIYYHKVTHYREKLKNSENKDYEIYFDDKEKPVFSKIKEDHYTSREVLSSLQYFLSLPKDLETHEKTNYSDQGVKNMINEIFDIIKSYKVRE